MVNFFFDIIEDDRQTRDEHGIDLERLDEAFEQAVIILPDMARDELPDGKQHTFVCEIRDEAGYHVYRGTLTCRGQRSS